MRVKSWQKKHAEAQRIYELVLRENSKNIEAKQGLADIASWKGDHTRAVPLYEAVFQETRDREVGRKLAAAKAEVAKSSESKKQDSDQ